MVFNTDTGSIAVDSGPGPGFTLNECIAAAKQAKAAGDLHKANVLIGRALALDPKNKKAKNSTKIS